MASRDHLVETEGFKKQMKVLDVAQRAVSTCQKSCIKSIPIVTCVNECIRSYTSMQQAHKVALSKILQFK